jgi:hypothetical protein
MDLSNKSKLSISIIAILIVLLIILYICNNILNKNKDSSSSDCNCEVKKQLIVQNPSEIMIQNIKNIEPHTNVNNKDRLCLYYADWCGYSRQFLPVWEKLKTAIVSSNLKDKVVVAEFECDKDKEMCQKNKEIIPGYPTVVLHKSDGKNIPYEGQREVEAIINFMKREI